MTIREKAQDNPPELWSISAPMGHDSRLQALAANDRFLFAAGYKGCGEGLTYGVVRGYNARTGDLRWERLFGEGADGAHAYSLTLSANGKELFVTGVEPGPAGPVNLVLSYDADTGDLLWRAPQEGRIVSSLHFSNILYAGDRLFTGCTITEEDGTCHWEIKAYRAQVFGEAPAQKIIE